jgi:hypothetical protein
MKLVKNFCFLIAYGVAGMTLAQSRTNVLYPNADPRGDPELIVCSQNLENYGSYSDVKSRNRRMDKDDFKQKEQALIKRFIARRCDVIAVQELIGKEGPTAEAALMNLATLLQKSSNRFFDHVVGPSNDKKLRVGFLIAKDRADIVDRKSFVNVELPKLSENQKQRFFSRGPLEVQLRVKPRGESFHKVVTLITFHFKSKSTKGGTDPAGLEFEPFRLEMSEALRRIINVRHADAYAGGQKILVVLGDRNSHFDAASARILEGVLTLKSFQGSAPCRLSKRGVPLCQAGTALPQRLFSVLTSDPETGVKPGTLKYQSIYSWIDDILLPVESLPFAWVGPTTTGDYDSGVDYLPAEASDHAMVWVALNW